MKIKRTLYELMMGEKAYLPKKKYKTKRTKDIEESASKQMGKGESLQEELKKLRRRGK